MADIVAADVTYTLVQQRREGGPRHSKRLQFNVVFGNNTLTYPTGGVPLTAAKLGCPNSLELLRVLDQGANAKGYKFEWDRTNNKLLVLVASPAGTVAAPTFTGSALAAHRHTLFVATGGSDAAGTRLNTATDLAARSDAAVSIAGIAAASGAAGGVVDVTGGTPAGTNSAPAFTGTAAVLAQHANATFVPNPATLLVEVVGY